MSRRGADAHGFAAAVSALARDGFALVPRVLDRTTVHELRGAIVEALATGRSDDLLRAPDGHVRKLTYPLEKHPAFLRALAAPEVLGLALALSPDPEDIVLTWEDILLKPARIGLGVPVHQDIALQSVHGNVYSLGIHLDAADDNPVRFIRGSHREGPLSREALHRLAEASQFVVVRPQTGDVVAHDVLVVHESAANTAGTARTTWYLEFRTRAQLRKEGPWPEAWGEQRRALLFHAAAAREAAGLPTLWPPCRQTETRQEWLARPCVLRVPHVGGGVEYDLASPYNHFA